jgi:hypothetical protein
MARCCRIFIRRFHWPAMVLVAIFVCRSTLPAQTASGQAAGGRLEGQITDPSGAAIPGAAVTAQSADGIARNTSTDREGRYRFAALPYGSWTVRITSPGFRPVQRSSVEVNSAVAATINAQLEIQAAADRVTVSDVNAGLAVDATQNAGQIVLRGDDLDAFSDDPDDLANELQMLAGPAPGPDGPQIFIDGFTGGRMPPKQSIREIRVNQNPFSSEFDRVGFGRIEILTKPGSDKFHGQAQFDFANRALTARNPYLVSPVVPDYKQELFSGNFGGPLSKHASFFVDADRRIIDENSVVNYTGLDASLNPVTVNGFVISPTRRTSVSPRVDYALSPNHTLTMRYSFVRNSGQNQGIGTQAFDLASQGYGIVSTEQTAQVSETAVLGSRAINDARFQFIRTRVDQTGNSTAPEFDVQGAFTGGGTFALNYTDRSRYEFIDTVTLIRGAHTVKFGGRLRDDHIQQSSETNFNGRFIFSAIPGGASALSVYQQTLAGVPGYGPSEFLLTAGNPLAGVNVADAGVFVQDDWRLRPNLSVSAGLRYEVQNGVSDHTNFAPRIGVAWAPGGRAGRSSKTVIRGGSGIFYDRFTSDLLIHAEQLNGVNQTQYIIRNPAFFPNVPDAATLAALSAQQAGGSARAVYQVDGHLRVPYLLQNAVGIERQLPKGIALAVNYANTRGVHQLLTRDINAPLPTVFDAQGVAEGPRPYGAAAGDIYQYEGSGSFRQNQVIVSSNAKVGRRVSVFGYYVYGRAYSNTDGPNSMPANPYDLHSEWGRAAYDNRHRGFISATTTLPWKVRMAPFIFMQSGRPYNLTSGVDTNNDGNPADDRPAFAQNLARASVIQKPGFGAFDVAPLTLPDAVLVPRNYLEGPGIFALTVRVSRSWTFGETGRGGGNTGGDEIRGGAAIQNGGLSGSSSQSGLASVLGGVATAKRYTLTASAQFRNALNNVNPATPIGNLTSPYFGKSLALNTFGPLPGVGPNAGAGNRHIELQLRLTF